MIEPTSVPKKVREFNKRKRLIDLALVILTSPFTVIAIIVVSALLLLTQGRPILFRQKRLGYLERQFWAYKFRSMNDARDPDGHLLPDDQRLTHIGKMLRKTSLDELPQLLNVIKGQMSLIGPRPLFVRYQPFYAEQERARHWVRPGITGLAQVSGRNHVKWNERLELDSRYARAASIWGDIKIICQTILQVLSRKDIVVIASESGRPLDVDRRLGERNGFAIRHIYVGDLPARVNWFSDPTTRQYMSIAEDVSLDSTIAWYHRVILANDRWDFAIYELNTEDVCAFAGVREIEGDTVESYIVVDPSRRGQGVGSITQHMLLDWVFANTRYEFVASSVRKDNLASKKLHETFATNVKSLNKDRALILVQRDAYEAKSIP